MVLVEGQKTMTIIIEHGKIKTAVTIINGKKNDCNRKIISNVFRTPA